MTTQVEKRNHAKFCEFHGEVGHNTNECMHLRKQIEEMLKAGKLSHLIKEIKQTNRKEQPKVTKKGETSRKDKALAILMVQPWERVARQRITQSFSPNQKIFFPPLGKDDGTKGPMIIEAKIGGHCVHPTTPLIGFSGEIIWPIGQIQLLAKFGDEEHSALAWINFMIVRLQSPKNGIIGRPGVRKLQAVPLTAHRMLKILVEGGVITLKSSKLVSLECAMVFGPAKTPSTTKPIAEEKVKVAINSEYLEQTVMIGSTLTEGDAYKGYYQIQMATEDEEKTTFITSHGIYSYTKMPFGLRNVGVTYQRLVDKAFHKQIGRNLEVYVDDLVIKSCTEVEIVRDIEETFKTLREINMKLNPKKCAFGWKKEYGSGAGLILTNLKGMEFTYALRFMFDAINNEAEYEALIAGLRIAEQMGVKNLQVKALAGSFKAFSFKQIPRSENKKADALSKIASTSFAHLTDVKKARAIKRKSWRFAVVNETLYKKYFLGPWLRCVRPLQDNYVLREIHEGSCSMHVGLDFLEKLSQIIENSFGTIRSKIGAKNYLRRRNKIKVGCKKRELDRRATPTEAIISAEIGMPTLRTAEVDLLGNNEALEINLDLLEERKEEAAICEAKSKAKMEKYYNSKVRNTSFKPGDLVYRNNKASRAKDTGKLGPKWEGPYEVTETLGKGTYKLRGVTESSFRRPGISATLRSVTFTKCKQFTHADSAVGVMHSSLSYLCIVMFSFLKL
nr:reverse transcriptase domain-containing protein [Tanacetum cinerariifolium]